MPKPTPNPFTAAKAAWLEDFAHLVIAKRNWQILSFIQLGIMALLIAGLIHLSVQSRVVPYIIEVDKLGRMAAIEEAKPSNLEDERIIRAHLYRFVELWRGVMTDIPAMRQNLRQAYKIVTPSMRANMLDPYYQQQNVLELATRLSRQVVPLSFLKQSQQSYIIEWRETERDLSGKEVVTKQYKALVGIKAGDKQNTKTQVKYDPYNPLGIFITNLSWSEVN